MGVRAQKGVEQYFVMFVVQAKGKVKFCLVIKKIKLSSFVADWGLFMQLFNMSSLMKVGCFLLSISRCLVSRST